MTRFFLAWTAIYAATLLTFAAIDIGTRIWHNLAIVNNSGYSDDSIGPHSPRPCFYDRGRQC